MHHKRGRAKKQRAGIYFTKPQKANGASPLKGAKASDQRRMLAATDGSHVRYRYL